MLIFLNLAFGLVAAHLFVERVEQLLSGGGSGKCGAVIERPAKAAEIQQAFGGAIKRHAHTVEEVDDAGSSLAHGFHGRLVGQKVAAINDVVEMLPGGIA